WEWGRNDLGQLGDGTTTTRTTPTQVGTSTDWTRPASGATTTLAVRTNGTLWAWGDNSNGSIGVPIGTRPLPGLASTTGPWKSASLSEHGVAIRGDGTLWAGGANDSGQIGNGTLAAQNAPVQVGTVNTWAAAAAGGEHTVA